MDVDIDESKLVDPPRMSTEAEDATCVAFGISERPKIWFYADEHCGHDPGFMHNGICYAGLQGGNGIVLAAPDDTSLPASSTFITHELAHWKWDDADHLNVRIWGVDPSTDGARTPGSRVGDMTLKLIADGM